MYDNEKILQIMPAPEGLRYSYDEGKTTEQVSFLALVELPGGVREVHAYGGGKLRILHRPDRKRRDPGGHVVLLTPNGRNQPEA